MANSDILGTQDMLCQELDEIESRRRRRAGTNATSVDDDLETHEQRAQRLQLSALCLSGGGIRSAAFCLGVLQVLAAKRMLPQFDYLSTVSGGGFIGGWLQVLMRESGGVGGAEDAIAWQGARSRAGDGPTEMAAADPAIRRRRYPVHGCDDVPTR
jgi:hypothetical protein